MKCEICGKRDIKVDAKFKKDRAYRVDEGIYNVMTYCHKCYKRIYPDVHKCKFYPTGVRKFIPNGINTDYSEDDEVYDIQTGVDLVGWGWCKCIKHLWMCECGKTKWVKEK